MREGGVCIPGTIEADASALGACCTENPSNTIKHIHTTEVPSLQNGARFKVSGYETILEIFPKPPKPADRHQTSQSETPPALRRLYDAWLSYVQRTQHRKLRRELAPEHYVV